ncbi:MAG TPA: hypothetical protein VNN77_10645 [candidate division Zixibacteria bacterium]|nr:hypothetical protein [candidate division Zixibacteria bacterium]
MNPQKIRLLEEQYRRAARELYEHEGMLEIDDQAAVTLPDGEGSYGAYVQAWVWVGSEEAKRHRPTGS